MCIMKLLAAAFALVAAALANEYPPTLGQHLCCIANAVRTSAGLQPLKWHPMLDIVSTNHSKWMQVSDSLTNEQTPGTDTYTATDRLNSISFGFTDASGYVMNGFETLEGIQKSLLASKDLAGYMLADANVCGGGAANDTGTWYTAMFVFAEEREVWQAFEFTCNESTSQGIVPHQQS